MVSGRSRFRDRSHLLLALKFPTSRAVSGQPVTRARAVPQRTLRGRSSEGSRLHVRLSQHHDFSGLERIPRSDGCTGTKVFGQMQIGLADAKKTAISFWPCAMGVSDRSVLWAALRLNVQFLTNGGMTPHMVPKPWQNAADQFNERQTQQSCSEPQLRTG